MIVQAGMLVDKTLSMPVPFPPHSLPSSSVWLTQLTDRWLIHALNKYKIQGKAVVCVLRVVSLK